MTSAPEIFRSNKFRFLLIIVAFGFIGYYFEFFQITKFFKKPKRIYNFSNGTILVDLPSLLNDTDTNIGGYLDDNETMSSPPIIDKSKLSAEWPFFDFARYRKGEMDMLWSDYIKFHNLTLNGSLPPRFFILATTDGVGLGNRVEQLQWGLLLSVLSSRAFISSWTTPFLLNLLINSSKLTIDWLEHDHKELIANLRSVRDYPEVQNFTEAVKAGSLINTLGDEEGLTFSTFRVIDQPGSQIYNNPLYKDTIPEVLGNWKTAMLRALFTSPTDTVLDSIRLIKRKISSMEHTQLITIQLRHYAFHGYSETRPERMWGCLKYFDHRNITGNPEIFTILPESNDTKTLFYLSSDTKEQRDNLMKIFPKRVLTMEDIDKDLLPVHVNEGLDDPNYYKNLIGVMVDWWMIGEGDLKVITGKSSFGGTAADRTFTKRFIVNYVNQCTDTTRDQFATDEYVPLLKSWNETGVMRHINEQKKKKK